MTLKNIHPRRRLLFCGVAALSALLLAAPPSAHAQAPGGGKTVTISLQNAPVQTVLRSLFKSAGQNFTIDPAVTGSVNVDVNGVSFQQALDAILSGTNPPLQAPLVNGIYQVGVQQAQPAAPPANNGANVSFLGPNTPSTATDPHHAYRIPISHYDAAYMSYLVAAFSIKGGAPIIVPSDPTSQMQGNSQGGGYGNGNSNNGNNRSGFGGQQGGFGTNTGYGNNTNTGFGNTGYGTNTGFGNTGSGFGGSGFGTSGFGGF